MELWSPPPPRPTFWEHVKNLRIIGKLCSAPTPNYDFHDLENWLLSAGQDFFKESPHPNLKKKY